MIKKILLILLLPFFVSAQSASISGNDTICDNESIDAQVKITFTDVSFPVTFIYAIDSISQPTILSATETPYIINTQRAGVYTLQSYSDANNDAGSISGSALVTIQQAPTALFTTLTDTLSILYPSIQLNDFSTGDIIAWSWSFGDNTPNDSIANPFHTYRDSIGVYQLSLIVTDDFGCSDIAFKQIWIADEYWMYIPNAFTPDLDGVNDLFCLEYHAIRENTFLFKIYNTLGTLLYQIENPKELSCELNNGWNGKHYEIQKDLPSDTYVYEVYFQDLDGWKHTEYGTILLVR